MSESSEQKSASSTTPDDDQLELKLPDESSAPRDLALWAGVLVLLTLITCWPATAGSFLWRDDVSAMSRRFVGPGALPRIWGDRWSSPDTYGQAVYQPVALIAYWAEYQLGGHTAQGLPAPMAYHIASLIFHAGTSILLWLLLRELLITGAWLIAAVFALHPLHAEPVSWIAVQPIALMGLLFIGSIFSYLLFVKNLQRDRVERAGGNPGVDPAQTWGLFAGAVLLCLMAMLCDPSAVVLPGSIIAHPVVQESPQYMAHKLLYFSACDWSCAMVQKH